MTNCPCCARSGRLYRTRDDASAVIRLYRCAGCKSTWEVVETDGKTTLGGVVTTEAGERARKQRTIKGRHTLRAQRRGARANARPITVNPRKEAQREGRFEH